MTERIDGRPITMLTEAIRAIPINPSEDLILEYEDHLTVAQVNALKEQAAEALPGVRVMVISGGIKVKTP